MGDGIQKKYVLIINGDTKPRHLENVDDAVAALRREGSYSIAVASTQAPKDSQVNFGSADEAGLQKLIRGLSTMDDDDLFVIYTTGHGGEGKQGEGCVDLPKSCYSLTTLSEELNKLKYGKRIVVMDQCYGGKSFPLFANLKTTIVTQGSPGEVVSCQLFSPYFWSDKVPDRDHDGMISIQERYEYTLEEGKTPSLTQSLIYDPISLSGKVGKKPFQTADGLPSVVSNKKELDEQLEKLKPGQLALVMFGADWCNFCHAYQPTFEKLSKEYAGRFLMIRAEGIKGSEEDWVKAYKFRSWPTVAFIDHRDSFTIVKDRDDPLESLASAALMDPEEEFEAVLRQGLSTDETQKGKTKEDFEILLQNYTDQIFPKCFALLSQPDSPYHAFVSENLAENIFGIREKVNSKVPNLIKLLSHPSPKVRASAAKVLGPFYELAGSAIDPLLQLFFDDDAKVRESASNSVSGILSSLKKDSTLGALIHYPDISKTLDTLIHYLSSENAGVRAAAANALKDVPEKCISSLPLFIQLLEDKDPEVRKNIIVLLARFFIREVIDPNQPEIIAKMIQRIEDGNQEVRRVAAQELIVIGNLFPWPSKPVKLPTSNLLILDVFPKLLRLFPEEPHTEYLRIGNTVLQNDNPAKNLQEFFYRNIREFKDRKNVILNLVEGMLPLLEDENLQIRGRALDYLHEIFIVAPFSEMESAVPVLKKLSHDPYKEIREAANDLLDHMKKEGLLIDRWRLGASLIIDQRGNELGGGFSLSEEYSLNHKERIRGSVNTIITPYVRTDLMVGPAFTLDHKSTQRLIPYFSLLEVGFFHYWKEKSSGLAVSPVGVDLKWKLGENIAAEGGIKFAIDIPFDGSIKMGTSGRIGFTGQF